MKYLLVLTFALFSLNFVNAQNNQPTNLLVITTDGLRWKELFRGADSALLFQKRYYGQDSLLKAQKYWADNVDERRKKLMPFVWGTLVNEGQLYGNRDYQNYVNVSNPFWFSYPGYSEIFTGYVDTLINTNAYPDNPNTNILEIINKTTGYENKVCAFTSWDVYPQILNEKRSGILVNSGYEELQDGKLSESEELLNDQQNYIQRTLGNSERMDASTFSLAKSYILKNHPKAIYLSFIETDGFGHHGEYDSYLDAAHHVDAMIKDIWTFIQSDPFYKNNTLLFITTDHGRGDDKDWTSHGSKISHSDEIWFAAAGKGVVPKGEMKMQQQLYQNQFAKTIMQILNIDMETGKPTGKAIETVFEK